MRVKDDGRSSQLVTTAELVRHKWLDICFQEREEQNFNVFDRRIFENNNEDSERWDLSVRSSNL